MHERAALPSFSGVCAKHAQRMNAHACSRRGIDAQIKSSAAHLNGFAALDRSNSIIVTPVSTSIAERTLANTSLGASLVAGRSAASRSRGHRFLSCNLTIPRADTGDCSGLSGKASHVLGAGSDSDRSNINFASHVSMTQFAKL